MTAVLWGMMLLAMGGLGLMMGQDVGGGSWQPAIRFGWGFVGGIFVISGAMVLPAMATYALKTVIERANDTRPMQVSMRLIMTIIIVLSAAVSPALATYGFDWVVGRESGSSAAELLAMWDV
jgi:hypothetical protein